MSASAQREPSGEREPELSCCGPARSAPTRRSPRVGIKGVVAAVVASACCTGPLLLLATGAGTGLLAGAGGILPVYAPLVGALLMFAFLAVEVRRRGGGSFSLDGLRRARLPVIGGLLAFATTWLVMTSVVTPLLADAVRPDSSTSSSRSAAQPAGLRQPLELRIDGMYCPSCVAMVRSALSDVEGVSKVEDVWIGGARLTYDPGLVTAEEIRQATTFYSFTARIEPPTGG